MSLPKYSVIIAAHNESQSIGQLLAELLDALKQVVDFEIFISEDGSRDNTREVVEKMIISEPRIRLSANSNRRGYSGAVQYGIRESRGEILLFLDGDGQTDPHELVKLTSLISHEKQIIVGVRTPRVDSVLRKLQSRLFYLVYRLLGFPKLKDPSSGSIVCYRNAIIEITDRELILPFGFWWEFQAWACLKEFQVTEVNVPHRQRIAGTTQVYLSSKLLGIAFTHLKGLYLLHKEFKK
jgi:glycosyltransferase involved in cell wall biosynthesis